MFCFTSLYVNYSFAIILMGKRELAALLSLSSWCLVMVVWHFLYAIARLLLKPAAIASSVEIGASRELERYM